MYIVYCCCCVLNHIPPSLWWSCRRVSSLFLWPCGALHPVLRAQRKALTVGVYYGWIPCALSIVMGSVSFSHSVSVLFSLSLSLLQPPGPDIVHCSLHGNCITLSVCFLLSFSELPPPLGCCWFPRFTLLLHLLYFCIAPAVFLLCPLILCSNGFLGTDGLTVCSDGARHHGGGWRRDRSSLPFVGCVNRLSWAVSHAVLQL